MISKKIRGIPLFKTTFWLILTVFPFFMGCSTHSLKLDKPMYLAVTKDESALIIGEAQKRVIVTNLQFKHISTFFHPSKGSSSFSNWGMCFSPLGQVVIADFRQERIAFSEEEKDIAEILFFDTHGTLKGQFTWANEDDPLRGPIFAWPLSNGDCWVADVRQNRVVRLNSQGKVLQTFGEKGPQAGHFHFPQDIRVLSDGRLLILDCYNSRIQVLDATTGSGTVIIEKGPEAGKVLFPQNFCLDNEGNLYVSELETMRVSVFDRNFRFKLVMKPTLKKSTTSGEKDIFQLAGLVFLEKSQRLLVADPLNSCIHVFSKDGKWLEAIEEVKP